MNVEWSNLNKDFQAKVSKKVSFEDGKKAMFVLRKTLFDEISLIMKNTSIEDFSKMPFPNAKGYHNKTLIYSVWHIFRIEDIVCHSLILNDEQVLFSGGWQKKCKSPIITTGNELKGEGIVEFSKKLDVASVYEYAKAVMESSDKIIKELKQEDLKRKFSDEDKKRILNSCSVSSDPDAVWLIDYWCDKDILGLLKMPFSRHWIMHIEAMLRILKGL